MKKANLLIACASLFLLSATLVYIKVSAVSNNLPATGQAQSLPKGEWFLTCRPTKQPQPVADVYSVTTDSGNALTITEVGVRNRSSRKIIAVKIGWHLYRVEDENSILLKGETPLLGVTLSPKERRTVQYPVVSFAKIYPPLVKDGELKGQFRIIAFISDVVFEDGQAMSNQGNGNASIIRPVNWLRPAETFIEVESAPDPNVVQGNCQKQECVYSASISCYQCKTEDGFNCQWNSCSSCTESRCDMEVQ